MCYWLHSSRYRNNKQNHNLLKVYPGNIDINGESSWLKQMDNVETDYQMVYED